MLEVLRWKTLPSELIGEPTCHSVEHEQGVQHCLTCVSVMKDFPDVRAPDLPDVDLTVRATVRSGKGTADWADML